MKEIIMQALSSAHALVVKQTPETKTVQKHACIMGLTPSQLANFVIENNIPEEAEIGTINNASGEAFGEDEAALIWNETESTTIGEKATYQARRFNTVHTELVFKALLANGWKRKSLDYQHFKKAFEHTSVYNMYMVEDWDGLERWYSFFFTKPE